MSSHNDYMQALRLSSISAEGTPDIIEDGESDFRQMGPEHVMMLRVPKQAFDCEYNTTLREQYPGMNMDFGTAMAQLQVECELSGMSPAESRAGLFAINATNKIPAGWTPRCTFDGFPPLYQFASPYALTRGCGHERDGNTPSPDARILSMNENLPRPTGTINAKAALGNSEHVLQIRRRDDDSKIFQDTIYGPGRRMMMNAQFSQFDLSGGGAMRVDGPIISREYYDEQGRTTAELFLNYFFRPTHDTELLPLLALFNPETGFPTHQWMWGCVGDSGQEDKFIHAIFDEDDGRKLRFEKSGGITQFFTGERLMERMSAQTMSQEFRDRTRGDSVFGAVVSEHYGGPPGRSYLRVRTFENGVTEYYAGTTPQKVSLARRWYPDGRVVHFAGERGEEFEIRRSVVPRTTEDVLSGLGVWQASTHAQPNTERSPPEYAVTFPVDARVRAVGLSQNHLNNLPAVVIGHVVETGRVSIRIGNKPGMNVLPEKLMTEEAWQEDRMARDQRRSTRAQEMQDRRRAQQLVREQELEEKRRAEEARAAAEAEPYNAELEQPRAPPTTKCSPRIAASCPITRQLFKEPVRAGDGYVYEKAALYEYWQANDYVSPITGDAISPVVHTHMALRSLAHRINDMPSDPQWNMIPKEVPEWATCSISFADAMCEPVLAADGWTYERLSITTWFRSGRETSPHFNEPISTELHADLTMQRLCSAWIQ